ncbi:hypothetical protein FQP85_08405 [Pseudoalteromonas neustonica]|uniref:Uncharacterized protein n=1 Tax=Pseudoalteromonas neustonica TaxID=1840331 RepID=A0ABY3FEX8_9GAMM|nr:hypothetical protein [Pseudoalteromonas neustonica]TVU83787.1 hypothetical protein FQP85_08405 [Pseudoalteromonas neustonica]
MSFLALLTKGHALLEIATKVLDIVEDVKEIGDDKKPKTDERGQPIIKKQIRKVQPEEVFDFKVERETGVVKALTKAGQRVEGVLAAADLAEALLVSDGASDVGKNLLEQEAAAADKAKELLANAELDAANKAKDAEKQAADIIAKAHADAKALLDKAEKDAKAAADKAPAKPAADKAAK